MAIPEGSRPRPLPFRLSSGLERLDKWSQDATQVEKNVVNRVLFAVTSKTVFSEYVVVDDVVRTMEFFVLAKCGLAIKIRVHGLDSFGIVYIGPTSAAPGLDQAAPDPEVFTAGPGPDLLSDARRDEPTERGVQHS
jgi:hypothetical protein